MFDCNETPNQTDRGDGTKVQPAETKAEETGRLSSDLSIRPIFTIVLSIEKRKGKIYTRLKPTILQSTVDQQQRHIETLLSHICTWSPGFLFTSNIQSLTVVNDLIRKFYIQHTCEVKLCSDDAQEV